MTSLHAICGLPPQLKILAKPMFETLQTLVLLATQLVRLLSPGYQNLNNNCTLFRIETLKRFKNMFSVRLGIIAHKTRVRD